MCSRVGSWPLQAVAEESRDLSRKLGAKLSLSGGEVPELTAKLQRSKRKVCTNAGLGTNKKKGSALCMRMRKQATVRVCSYVSVFVRRDMQLERWGMRPGVCASWRGRVKQRGSTTPSMAGPGTPAGNRWTRTRASQPYCASPFRNPQPTCTAHRTWQCRR